MKTIRETLESYGLTTNNVEHLDDPCYGVTELSDCYRLALDAGCQLYITAFLDTEE